MGNEASLEGGEGGLAGLPEGVASDGKGGFIQVPAGMEADLSQLSEEERKQIAAVMSRAQAKPPGNAKDAPSQRKPEVDANHRPPQTGKPPAQGPPGISKSQTVDALKPGPAGRQVTPGRSPSSVSLLESRSPQEVKDQPRTSMFSSNFLSGANPLSAVSSAVNKFSLFGDGEAEEEDEDEEEVKRKAAQQQGQKPAPGKGPENQQGGPPKQGKGTPQQGGPPQQASGKPGPEQHGPQGPPTQGGTQKQGPQGSPKQGGPQQQGPPRGGPQPQGPGKPGPQQQGPQGTSKQGGPQGPSKQGGPQQQGPPRGGAQPHGPGRPGPQQQGPPGPGPALQGPSKAGSQGPKCLCPLCKSTELNQKSKEQPNYNTCTQCKTVVCSLCGFSPPDSAGKEWLCLTCQMQRVLGGMDPPGPPVVKPHMPPKQAPKAEPSKPPETKKPSPLTKPQAGPGAGKPATPPATPPPVQKGPGPATPMPAQKGPGPATPPPVQKGPSPATPMPAQKGPGLATPPPVQKGPSPATPMPTQKGPGPATPPPAQKGPGLATPPLAQKGPGPATPMPAQKGPGPATPPPVQKGPGPASQTPVQKGPGPATPPPAQKGPSPASGQPKPAGPQEVQKPPALTQDPAMTGQQPPQQKPPQQQPHRQQQQGKPPPHQSSGGPAKTDPKSGRPTEEPGKPQQQMPKGSPGPSPAKSTPPPQTQPPKQESGFFGLSFGAKAQATPPQPAESMSGKLFGFAGFGEAAKPSAPATAAPPAEPVSGKKFGFGSIFSSASNLISSAVQDEPPAAQPTATPPASLQKPAQAKAPPQAAPKQAPKPSAQPPKATEPPPPPLKAAEPAPLPPKAAQPAPPPLKADVPAPLPPKASQPAPSPLKAAEPTPPPPKAPEPTPPPLKAAQPAPPPPKAAQPAPPSPKTAQPAPPPPKAPWETCPLCKVELNVGSGDPPNYDVCTECKKTVCNLCGFNPMPHLAEKEWLCLNCQTQRAIAGQLGDMGSMPPPMHMPTKPQQPAPPKSQPSPAKQPTTQVTAPVIAADTPPKTALDQPKTDLAKATALAHTVPTPPPDTGATRTTAVDHAPLQKPKDATNAAERKKEEKGVEVVETEVIKMKPEAATQQVVPQPDTIPDIETEKTGDVSASPEQVIMHVALSPADRTQVVNTPKAREEKRLPDTSEHTEDMAVPPEQTENAISSSDITQEVTASKVVDENSFPCTESKKIEDVPVPPLQEVKHAISSSLDSMQAVITPNVVEDNSLLEIESKKIEDVPVPPLQEVEHAISSSLDSMQEVITPNVVEDNSLLEIESEKIEDVSVPSEQEVEHTIPSPPDNMKKEVITLKEETSLPERESEKIKDVSVVPEHAVENDTPSPSDSMQDIKAISTKALEDNSLLETDSEKIDSSFPPDKELENEPLSPTDSTQDEVSNPKVLADKFLSDMVSEKAEDCSVLAEQEIVHVIPSSAVSAEGEVSSHKGLEESPLPVPQEKELELGEVQPLKMSIEVDAVKPEKEGKFETSGSSQQKSPQGLSDTGYSSEGISGSLGEIPSVVQTKEKEPLIEPVQKDTVKQDTSPTSPSDLAKLESTVLPLLESQTSRIEKEDPCSNYGVEKEQHRKKILPVSSESYSSGEEALQVAQEMDASFAKELHDESVTRKDRKKLHILTEAAPGRRQRSDSVEDSSESEPSPLLQRRRKISTTSSSSEDYKKDSPCSGDEEEFIRKQIMGMSANEEPSPSDEDNYIRKEIREQEQQCEEEERNSKEKSTSGELQRLVKKSSFSYEDELTIQHSLPETEEPERKTVSLEGQENVRESEGVRHFKPIEFDNKAGALVRQATDEGDQEVESLTESPEDRSRGEGSSSVHASSFTPGTSPTSVSSLDEDSDSSPSHKKMSSEGKHRKSRHRQHGQMLPTIEDSSEEEEMREEEELLRELEMQREVDHQQGKKSSSKKSKKDKEELRAQRRREYPKTPPSNLSPIEDASPTEELRQAAEMEELHKSSCSDYSPSIESEPEGFEINLKKIHTVQEDDQLSTSTSVYSPTDEQQSNVTKDTTRKILKSADEAYEEIMQKAQALEGKEIESPPEIEPLYSGMVIEDYIYESLIEDQDTLAECVAEQQDSSKISIQQPLKKLRSPDEVYEDMMLKRKEIMQKEQELQQMWPIKETHLLETVLPPTVNETCYVPISPSDAASSAKDGKLLLDAEAAYEEIMKQQRINLTHGSSPTQPVSDLHDTPEVIVIPSRAVVEEVQEKSIMSVPVSGEEPSAATSIVSSDAVISRSLYPIPDLKITQCSSGEEDIEEEDSLDQREKPISSSEMPPADKTEIKEQPSPETYVPTSEPGVVVTDREPLSVDSEVSQPQKAPIPTPAPAPTKAPLAAPTKAPLAAPTPATAPTKAPVAAPVPHPATVPVPVAAAAPPPAAIPAAAPVEAPVKAPAQPPAPTPPKAFAPTPATAPAAACVPTPAVVPIAGPAPTPAVVPIAGPAPTPAAACVPTPAVVPTPTIAPAPTPVVTQSPTLISEPLSDVNEIPQPNATPESVVNAPALVSEQISCVCDTSEPRASSVTNLSAAPVSVTPTPSTDPDIDPISVVCEVPQSKTAPDQGPVQVSAPVPCSIPTSGTVPVLVPTLPEAVVSKSEPISVVCKVSLPEVTSDIVTAPIATPVPVLDPIPDPVSIPIPEPVSAPVSVSVPIPEPVSIPLPVSIPIPEPVSTPLPVSIPIPEPILTPLPFSVPIPEPVPVPLPEPVSAPVPIMVPTAEPVSAPVHVSVPIPEPVSAPVPVSIPISEPVPAPLPELVSAPVPIMVPTAEPVSAPVHVSVPIPEPVSAPVPIIVPTAEPVSAPVHVSVSIPEPVSVPVPVMIPTAHPVSAQIHVPVPTSEPVSAPVYISVPIQESGPVPEPVSVPIQEPGSVPEPVSVPVHVSVTIPESVGVPEPVSVTVPVINPATQPVSAQTHAPVSTLEPVSAPVHVSVPIQEPYAISEPVSVTVPVIIPSAQPVSAQTHTPVLTSEPISAPVLVSVTVQEPVVIPEPASVPVSVMVPTAESVSAPTIDSAASQVPVSEPTTAPLTQVRPPCPPPQPPLPKPVTLPQTITEIPAAEAVPYVPTTFSMTLTPSQPVDTVVVDIQPNMEDPILSQSSISKTSVTPPLPVTVSSIISTAPVALPVTPPEMQTAQGHVVISVPSIGNISDTSQDIVASTVSVTTTCPVIEATSQISSTLPPLSSFSGSTPSVVVSISPIPTLPQYAPVVSTVVSATISASVSTTQPLTSAPPVPPKPVALLRASSQEKVDIPVTAHPPPPPPLPPPTLPKPALYPQKPPFSTPQVCSAGAAVPVSAAMRVAQETIMTTGPTAVKGSMGSTYKPNVPPPVPPKPASIPAGLIFSHKPGESVRPPVAPKPVVAQQIITVSQPRPVAPENTGDMTLNLNVLPECRLSATSPRSPLSPRYANSLHETYVVITLPSEPSTPVEGIVTQAPTSPAIVSPSKQPPQAVPAAPVAFTQYTKSVESQEIQGSEKVLSSMSHVYSSISTAAQPAVTLPSLVAQVVTTEVQRTTVSVVRERIPGTPPSPAARTASVAIAIPPETAKIPPKPKENGRMYYSSDVVDLRTLKVNVEMTDKGLDLSAPNSRRQSFSSDSSGRQTSAVQSAIVNLSAESVPASTLSVVTDSITIVTCTATIAYNNGAADRSLDLGHVGSTSMPLQLTTSKPFEPVAQIIYRALDSKPIPASNADAPINLSFGAITNVDNLGAPVTVAPASITNGISLPAHVEVGLVGAIDLTTSKPVESVVTVDGPNSAVVSSIVEDDGKPVDLTAGRRVICCDVVYSLPFAGSCGTQQPPTKLSEDHFGYPDDHYQYDHTGTCDTKVSNGVTPSISENNLGESGLFCEDKNGYGYPNGATEGAVDLTAGKMSTGAIMDYTRKGAGAYSGMTIPQYSQARITPTVGTHFGVNSALRSSNGVVYSSITAPVPSTYAVTTQPGSIFSTTYDALSGMHTHDTMPAVSSLKDQTFSQSYSFLPTTATAQEQAVSQDMGGMSAEFPQVVPTPSLLHDTYTDATLEAIAASLEALASPLTTDDAQQQYQMERDLLELEKIKQLHLAEELEWERLEIQRFREHEQILVQKELEELQSMKQQLLLQQEEEHQAHLLMQQETYAQQQLQLEQIQQLQQQLQQQLEEQKMRHLYPYGYDPSEGGSPLTSSEQNPLDQQYAVGDNGQYWPVQDGTTTSSSVIGLDLQQNTTWYTVPMEGVAQYITSLPGSTEMPQNENQKHPQLAQRITTISNKKIVDSGVQTDDEDGVDKAYTGRRRRNKKSVDSSVQTDDEDQEDWDIPTRSRRKSRSSKQGSKVSSIAIQTVAEISVQTDSSGTIKRPSVKLDTKLEIGKQGSSLEKTYRGGSVTCQTDTGSGMSSPEKDKRRPTPLEIGYNTHLKADSSLQVAPSPPKSPKVLYSPISPLSPSKSIERVQYDKCVGEVSPQKMLTADQSPRTLKAMQRSISDPRSLSPAEERTLSNLHYSDVYSNKGSQSGTPSGTQKKVKRTLPNPPPEEDTAGSQSGYSTGSARRRLCRNTTIARAKILQDIDRELDLVERESSKLRKKQAELDEEEKEIDAKLRYLEMGINRRKDALLKEREKRERAYLQGVAEERDYMSDSEVSNIREPRGGNGHGRERPRTAPQSELNQFIPPQTQAEAQYGQSESPYAQYPYAPQTQATATQYSQQTLYQPSLYHQQASPYQSQSIYSSVPTLSYPQSSHQASQQQQGYQHSSQLLHLQQKARQATLSDLEPKNTTNYEVIHNQPLMMGSSSADPGYGIPHLGGGKYSSLDLRLGLEERSSMASSPMSSISADSFYADIDHHRNYVLIDDIGELTKGSAGLSSGFSIPDKDLAKADRLLRAAEVRRAAEVSDFLGPLQASSRLHPYGKAEEDSMEEPYELKLLKQQIKQEFRRGADGLDHLTGLPHYYPSESGYRHFPKAEKYSIGRLTLEKQAAKQLPASVLYQKQAKHKKALMDPKVIKFSPIQESRDLEPDYGSYLGSSTSSVSALSSRARFLQDEITFGLRKNIAEQQKYLGSTLGANLAHSLNLGQTVNLGPTMRSSLVDDGTYPSGSRSRPSSRPSSVYGLDLSIKRDSSSSSLRLKADGEPLDASFTVAPTARAKPTSLPISQSRGRIPFVAQNSEEESPLSPVGQPMGMARASAGPLPPISADSRDQFGSSHSLPEVQQHMREESRTRGYDRDIAFMMDDLQGAMSDSEAGGASWDSEAYHLRREETDWFDKPREVRMESTHALDHRQMKPTHYPFPHARVKLQMDPKDHSVSGNGLGIRVVGGKEIPGNSGDIGAYIAKVLPGGAVEQSGQIVEGMQVLEWNGVPLTGKTYEDVQSLVVQQYSGAELCVRLDLNMLSDTEHPQHLELHSQSKAGHTFDMSSVDRQRSPGVDPKQLAAELQKVSQQQAPSTVTSAMEKGPHLHSGTGSATSSAVPSPGQPGSPSICKKRHSSKSAETVKTQAHPITGEIQLQINYDKNLGNLIVHVLQARNLAPRDNNGYSDPFVKVYLLPGRGQVMVVQNASAENKRRTKHMQKSLNPEWNQTVIYKNIHLEQLKKKTLEVTVWDYDRFSSNDFLGEVLIDLSNTTQLDNTPRWFPLKEQNEGMTDHGTSRSGSGSQQSPKPSVIKSRSHGIFPDPSKDMQVPTIEKSHSSPGSSKPSLEGQVRPHGPPHCQSKSAVGQAHQEDAGVAIAAAEAAAQQQHGLQPIRKKRRHRHSIDGVPTIQRTQSDYLPAPANENKDTSHLTIRKVMSDGTPSAEGARPGHRATDDSMTTASSVNSLGGNDCNLEGEGGTNAVDSAIFQVPRIGKPIPNGADKMRGPDALKPPLGNGDTDGKTQMMGEIKIALKKEMKTEGEQLIVEILQCRNITYKFKTPDHLPDLYVKLYVVNVATQKRVIKKKTRVCRHDREPSFNETFRFAMNPAGHSIQLFLVSNGGKFVKKTLIGEAYIWLDKVDLRKRAVSWHKLLASSLQTHP